MPRRSISNSISSIGGRLARSDTQRRLPGSHRDGLARMFANRNRQRSMAGRWRLRATTWTPLDTQVMSFVITGNSVTATDPSGNKSFTVFWLPGRKPLPPPHSRFERVPGHLLISRGGSKNRPRLFQDADCDGHVPLEDRVADAARFPGRLCTEKCLQWLCGRLIIGCHCNPVDQCPRAKFSSGLLRSSTAGKETWQSGYAAASDM